MAIETSSKLAKQMQPYPGQCQSTRMLEFPYRATWIQCGIIIPENHGDEHFTISRNDDVTIRYVWPGNYEHEKT
jgi:hypothetical protein